ncbi:DUF6468 domain-containing protein [Henriciella marina]|uniref:DUF6468 domain-containing protein n=1 Tax=Henriciella marina TaxID=453851 RepID=UPI00037446DA|nr:DUF6468 domain-containing protein [Henriciella marina]
MPDIQPIDIALFLVSLAACIYCVQLSRRLKSLQDTRDGLGATIMAMTKSVSAVSSATQETRNQAGELASRLSKLMKEADATCERLEDLIQRLEAGARMDSRSPSAPELVHSEATADGSLEQLIEEMRARQDRLRNAARSGDFLFEDDDAWVTRNTN